MQALSAMLMIDDCDDIVIKYISQTNLINEVWCVLFLQF